MAEKIAYVWRDSVYTDVFLRHNNRIVGGHPLMISMSISRLKDQGYEIIDGKAPEGEVPRNGMDMLFIHPWRY